VQIEVKLDASLSEPKVVIYADKMSDEVSDIVKKLSEDIPQMIAGFRDNSLEILEPMEIIRVYAAAGKTLVVTEKGEYTLRLRLYEMENRLDKRSFVRISNSEIIHLKKVKAFDLSFAGTICVAFKNGTVTYVSRRYVRKIKQVLGV
jgi:DNA-binding LytR/AlgR family response regulator